MPYFFILPAYCVLLVGLFGAGVVALLIPRIKPFSGYIFGGAIGTFLGFVIANIVVFSIGVAPAWLAQKFAFPRWLQQAGGFFAAAALLIGPFLASAIGVFVGFAGGAYFVHRRRRGEAQ